MPNGTPDVAAIPVPSAELKIPGVPAEATSFRALGRTVINFFSGLFGFGGGSGFRVVQTEAERDARIAAFNASRDPPVIPGRAAGFTFLPGTSIITGRAPIPTPALGGPPLVTERFEELPGPFVPEPDLPIMQELGIPFAEPELPQFLPFQPGPIPAPDILEAPMAVDAPILSASFVPALRQAVPPSITGFLGGFAADILQQAFRPAGELGLGQLPIPRAGAGVPTERPSTRILRMIKANTGVSVTLSRAKSLIRELGLQNAARCLGVTANEVCILLIAPSPRRRRGISGSDIRIVKRTARRFESLKHALGHIGGRVAHHPHRRRPHHHAHAK